eukprot:TRINITY_DN8056_c0_g1_i1.p1 TRINITY_DN8056_c0_g1~~TRINITY_DN8056_c0_g1_i1.p1  ORF type:complete len:1366 (+),score=362.90 TRINITY_DN8056_c0_g1_i1:94-4098(+)
MAVRVSVWHQREPCLTSRQSEAAQSVARARLAAAHREWRELQLEALAELRSRRKAASERRQELEAQLPGAKPQDYGELYEGILQCTSECDALDAHSAELTEVLSGDADGTEEAGAAGGAAEPPAAAPDPYDRVLMARAVLFEAAQRPQLARHGMALRGYPNGALRHLRRAEQRAGQPPCGASSPGTPSPRTPDAPASAELPEGLSAQWSSALLALLPSAAHPQLPAALLDGAVLRLASPHRGDGRGEVHGLLGRLLCGKSIMMAQIAAHPKIREAFPDGVVLACAGYADADDEAAVCAPLRGLLEGVGRGARGGGTQETLAAQLKGRLRGKRRLLCVDSCGSARLVAALRYAVLGSPSKVLVCSRRPLRWVDAWEELPGQWEAAECAAHAAARLPQEPPQVLTELASVVARCPLAVDIAVRTAAADRAPGGAERLTALLKSASMHCNANALLRGRQVPRRHGLYCVPLAVEAAVLSLPPAGQGLCAALPALRWDGCGVPLEVLATACGMTPGSPEFEAAAEAVCSRGLLRILTWQGARVAVPPHPLVVECLSSRFAADRAEQHTAIVKAASLSLAGCGGACADYLGTHLLWHAAEAGDGERAAALLLSPATIADGGVIPGGAPCWPRLDSLLVRHAAASPIEIPLLRQALRGVRPGDGGGSSLALFSACARLQAADGIAHLPRLRQLLKSLGMESRPAPRSAGGVLWAKSVAPDTQLLLPAVWRLEAQRLGVPGLAARRVTAACFATHPAPASAAAGVAAAGGPRVLVSAQGADGAVAVVLDAASLGELKCVPLCRPAQPPTAPQPPPPQAVCVLASPWGTLFVGGADGSVDEWHVTKSAATGRIDRFLFTDHVRRLRDPDPEGGPCTALVAADRRLDAMVVAAVLEGGTAALLRAERLPDGAPPPGLAPCRDLALGSQGPVCCALPGGALLAGAPGTCIVRAVLVGFDADPELSPPPGSVIHSLPPGEGVGCCCPIPAAEGRWRAACALTSGPIAVFAGDCAALDGGGQLGFPPEAVLAGHAAPCAALCATPCGGWIVSARHDGELMLWPARPPQGAAETASAEWRLATGSAVHGLIAAPLPRSDRGSPQLRIAAVGPAGVRVWTLLAPKPPRAEAEAEPAHAGTAEEHAAAARIQALQRGRAARQRGRVERRLLFSDGAGRVLVFPAGDGPCTAYDAAGSLGRAVPVPAMREEWGGSGGPELRPYADWHDAHIGPQCSAACAGRLPGSPPPSPPPSPPASQGRRRRGQPSPCGWAVAVRGRRVSAWPPRQPQQQQRESPAALAFDVPIKCACVSEHGGRAVLAVRSSSADAAVAFFDLLRFRPSSTAETQQP